MYEIYLIQEAELMAVKGFDIDWWECDMRASKRVEDYYGKP